MYVYTCIYMLCKNRTVKYVLASPVGYVKPVRTVYILSGRMQLHPTRRRLLDKPCDRALWGIHTAAIYASLSTKESICTNVYVAGRPSRGCQICD
eukprot:jgi/Botrbrau1/15304/Bobra.0096s0007.1